jgi:RNA polymerase sigma-70 factor (ECF subfamily)
MASSPPGTPRPPITEEQFMRLFLEAEREILRYVMAIIPNVSDARDIVQETATALWKAVAKYDSSKPFIPWACRFALNEARMHLRSEARRRVVLEEDVTALLDARRTELTGHLDARREHLKDCLGRLPSDQRSLVRDYYFEDQSIETLAARLGRTAEAVYKSLQRIRQALHRCVAQKLRTDP